MELMCVTSQLTADNLSLDFQTVTVSYLCNSIKILVDTMGGDTQILEPLGAVNLAHTEWGESVG